MAVALVWTLCALCLGGAAYWTVVAWRVRRDGRNRPGLALGLAISREQWPGVSVIIPSHNEEEHAPELLLSLLSQEYAGSLEVIFVLDRCTDGTRQALEGAHIRGGGHSRVKVRIIDNDSCPADWAGKCNAARVGAEAATGELLLFTDADTTFDPALVRCAVALLLERSLSLLSALPAVSARHAFESAVQPVAAMQLMKLYPIARVNASVRPRAFANGQFMLFLREAYNALGGHEAVKDDLLEDLAFARRMVHGLKRRAGLFVSDGLLHVRMYESFPQFREGWRRILIEACHRNPSRMRRYAIESAIVGAAVELAALAAFVTGAVTLVRGDTPLAIAAMIAGALALIAQKATLANIYRLIGIGRGWIWAYGTATLVLARILWKGADDLRHRRPVRWGGRQYVLAPQSD